ncbi:mechanosensitive ion channel family protein [Chelonobacter oris]|uniref:mechanosensitive ion channel family protein n=1 Tax=Chelonobacter oris TaxID=505317 RepID=UPI000689A3B6|nr:mechanosensitive ion channel family protein [Chelonobacter oris]
MQHDNGLSLAAQILETWQTRFIGLLPNIISAVALTVLFYFLAWFLRRATSQACQKLFPGNLKMVKIVSTLVYCLTCFAGVILVLDLLNLTNLITHLLAGAGIMGIVAGFAFKDIASNAFSGLLIKSQQPFKIADWVKINDYLGEVREIGMITTTLKTIEGKLAYVPNQLVYSGVFVNYSALGKQRVIISSGVSYGDDLDKVKAVTLAIFNDFDFVVDKAQTDFYFTDIGSSTYNFQVRFWIAFSDYTDYLRAKSDIIIVLKKCFEQENISIAYNVTTLDFGVKGGMKLFDEPIKLQA